MASRRVKGKEYKSWDLVGYAWKSGVIQSPVTGQPMRAVVAESKSGELYAGVRIGPIPGGFSPEIVQTSTFRPEGSRDLGVAVHDARAILRDQLVGPAQPY